MSLSLDEISQNVCIDLDGTLVRNDLFFESAIFFWVKIPFISFSLLSGF